jgi:hypothetical protein
VTAPAAPTWLTPDLVRGWLKLPAGQDDDLVTRCCAAVEITVQRCRPDGWSTDEVPVYRPDAEILQGATMFAAKVYRRRNSPAGVESFGESVIYTSTKDAETAIFLRQGQWAMPGVG